MFDESFSDSDVCSSGPETPPEPTVEELQEAAESDPSFVTHEALLHGYRREQRLTALAEHREFMARSYPLPEALWLDWLSDAFANCASVHEYTFLLPLFERALADYVSVEVWMSYLSRYGMLYKNDPVKVRALYERAVTAVGSHFVLGDVIWQLYRSFEMQQQQQQQSQSEEAATSQVVQDLYERELSLPLEALDRTWSSYQQWYASVHANESKVTAVATEEHFKQIQTKTDRVRIARDARAKIEHSLVQEQAVGQGRATAEQTATWTMYLQSERVALGELKPQFVLALHERCLTSVYAVSDFWLQYLQYILSLSADVVTPGLLLQTAHRAIRNCSKSPELWTWYLRAFNAERERDSGALSHLSLDEIYAKAALQLPPAQRIVPFIAYVKGSGRTKKMDQLLQQGSALALLASDEHKIAWGLFEARMWWQLSNATRACDVLERLVEVRPSDVQIWRAYLLLVLRSRLDDLPRVRSVYRRAVERVRAPKRDALGLEAEWKLFEQVHGSPTDFLNATRVCLKCARQDGIRTAKQALERKSKRRENTESKRKGGGHKGGRTNHKKQQQDHSSSNNKNNKNNKNNNNNNNNNNNKRNPDSGKNKRKKVTESSSPPQATEAGAAGPSKKRKTDQSATVSTAVAATIAATSEKTKQSSQTVFVLNLNRADTTVETLLAYFATHSPVSATVAVNEKGESLGHAQVRFATSVQAAQAAGQGTGGTLDGRKVQCVLTQEENNMKKHTIESASPELTVFVKGKIVDGADTAGDLKTSFAQCGVVSDVRLAYERSGRIKQFFYVQFATEAAVLQALDVKEVRCVSVRGKVCVIPITVHKYQRVTKKEKKLKKTYMHAAKTGKKTGSRGRKASTLDLPDAVRKAATAAKTTTTTPAATTAAATEAAVAPKALSNADFRALFLKK